MAVLPSSIYPITVPFVEKDGTVTKDWWLWLYAVSQQSLGTGNATAAATTVSFVSDNEIDAQESDISLTRRVESLERMIADPEVGPTILDVARALMLSQDYLPQDPTPRAQPVTSVTAGASPYTYQALYDGTMMMSGGTISALSVSRDGTTFYAVAEGAIPLSRLDSLKVTYSVAPTMTFFPR